MIVSPAAALATLVAVWASVLAVAPAPVAAAAGDGYERAAVLAALDDHPLASLAQSLEPSARPAGVTGAPTGGGAPSRAWADGDICHESNHTDPDDVAWLDVSSYGAFLDCTTGEWIFPAVTADDWPDSRLDSWAVVIDTDGSPSTGCGGYELLALAAYDTGSAAVVAGLVDTPTCDSAAWTTRAAIPTVRTSASDISLLVDHELVGSPTRMRWWTFLAPIDGDWADFAPDTGDHVEDLAACPPSGTTHEPQALYLSMADEAGASAAARALRSAGVGPVISRGAGVVAFHGSIAGARRVLQAAGLPAAVHVDRPREWAEAPDDPLYATQWELSDVAAEAAWMHTPGSASVVVAVLDSGVDANHPELVGQLAAGHDATTGSPLAPGNSDTVGHGTAVIGMVAARTGNGTGVASLGRETTVLPIKVGEESISSSALVAGLRHAIDAGADVINLSLGGPCASSPEASAIADAQAAGITVVAAAGNEKLNGNPPTWPASYPGVIGVGATTDTAGAAAYSGTGPFVDLVAPGGEPGEGVTVLRPGGGTGTEAGTSFAAPMVAAAVALAKAVEPGLTPAEVEAVLTGAAVDLGPVGRDDTFGHGLLDAGATVAQLAITDRLAGADRYATAAAVADDSWPAGSDLVYLATGRVFPDSLVAGALAGVQPGPLLLTAPCELPDATAAALDRLGPQTVVVIGGDGAVCPEVAAEVTTRTGASIERLAGPDRYQTAAALTRRGWASTASTVFIASGAAFPDGLTGAARAAAGDAPLLLVQPCALPTATAAELDRLRPTEVVVLGGTGAVCADVATAVAARTGAPVRRLSGADRYDTAAAVVRDGWPGATPVVYLSTGANFPDGLAAGPAAALVDGPLLLVRPCALPDSVADVIDDLEPDRVVVLGGRSAVCNQAAWAAALAAG